MSGRGGQKGWEAAGETAVKSAAVASDVVLLRSRRVVLPGGTEPAGVLIVGGRIAAIRAYDAGVPGATLVDAGEAVVMAGLVDPHVHMNEPGRTEWEGFATGTRAAAAGGVTTLVDMPLNSVPATTTAGALEEKRRAAADQCHVDVGFWGGVVPGNTSELEPLWRAGVLGFKAFLVASGVPEFAHVGTADLDSALRILARLDAPLLAHAELPGPIDRAMSALPSTAPPEAYATYLRTRPAEAELEAIALLVELARAHGAHVHVVHLATAEALEMLRTARASGVRISVETCPHYLSFAAEEIPAGATAFKCAPPIRERANREALWSGVRDGTIDFVATDHSPAPPATKCVDSGNFLEAWGGIASLSLGLAAVWTGARERGHTVDDISAWMSDRPAFFAGLAGRKGALTAGCDGDLVVWDPEATFEVDPAALWQRHPLTPYAGRTLRGVVLQTWLRGTLVYERGRGIIGQPCGRLLTR